MFKTMNLTMLTDFYEITMANGYLEAGIEDEIAYLTCFPQGARRWRIRYHGRH